MSRLCRLAAAIGLAAWAAEAQALQRLGGAEEARQRLARVESLMVVIRARDSAQSARDFRARRAQVFVRGDLVLVLPGTATPGSGQRIAADAVRDLDEFGGVPRSFLTSLVVVAYGSTDTAAVLGDPRYRSRIRARADIGLVPDTATAGRQVAVAVAGTYRASLDQDWRLFLPGDVGVGWTSARDGAGGIRALTQTQVAAGTECLAGKPAACRSWLGLNREADPFAARYRPAELRLIVAGLWWAGNDSLGRACQGGSDEACVEFARAAWSRGVGGPHPIPADDRARRSMVRSVGALHGAAALRRALADTTGSVGERLARAAGISEDSLVTEWRYWTLTRGGTPRVTAGFRDVWPVMVMAGLMLLAAARSGRWR